MCVRCRAVFDTTDLTRFRTPTSCLVVLVTQDKEWQNFVPPMRKTIFHDNCLD